MDQFLSIKCTSSIAGGVGVVSEVPVCGVVRIDEGVHIGLSGGLGGLDVVVVLLLGLLGVLVGLLLLLRDSRDSLGHLSRLPVQVTSDKIAHYYKEAFNLGRFCMDLH